MNLQALTVGIISAINPQLPATLAVSNGYTDTSDGSQVRSYAPPFNVLAQIQPLSTDNLRQMDGLNIQGNHQAIYLTGELDGVVRVQAKGGDLVTLQDGSVWLVVVNLEQWQDWCKVAATLQNGS